MIIAFAGFKGSGKSTATSYLESQGYVDVKMAAPLKAMLHTMYSYCGLDEEQIYQRLEGTLKESPDPWLLGKTPRHAMQQLGTEWRDSISENLWIPMWEHAVDSLGHVPICCSDIRFQLEVDALKRKGGKLVWIHRPNIVQDTHSSEQDISSLADVHIINSGTIEQLTDKIKNILL